MADEVDSDQLPGDAALAEGDLAMKAALWTQCAAVAQQQPRAVVVAVECLQLRDEVPTPPCA